jgi:hypothetical protein
LDFQTGHGFELVLENFVDTTNFKEELIFLLSLIIIDLLNILDDEYLRLELILEVKENRPVELNVFERENFAEETKALERDILFDAVNEEVGQTRYTVHPVVCMALLDK